MNSQLLLDLQAALSAALTSNSQKQTQASQYDPLVVRLRSGVSVLLNACATDASRHDGGLKQDVITVLSVVEFVAERLPVVFCGQEGLEAGPVCSLLALLTTAASRYRSLVDRMVGLLLRVVGLAPPAARRSLLVDLTEGAMELVMDAEQQLLLLCMPPPPPAGTHLHDCDSWGRGADAGGASLGAVFNAFEAFSAHGYEQWQQRHLRSQELRTSLGEEVHGGPDQALELTVQLGTTERCLTAAEAGAALLSALLLHRPQLLAPLVPPIMMQALLQLLVAATADPQAQTRLLMCAARLVAVCETPPLAATHATSLSGCEALLHIAVSLLEAWGNGALQAGDAKQLPTSPIALASGSVAHGTHGKAEASLDRLSTSADAATSWHSALCAVVDSCNTALEAGGLLASHANRLSTVLLHTCLSSAASSAATSLAASSADAAVAVPQQGLGAAHLLYLPRLLAVLVACPHVLPDAVERGLLELLLLLPPRNQVTAVERWRTGAPHGTSADCTVVVAAISAAAGLRSLCTGWLVKPAVSGLLAAAVRSALHILEPRPTAVPSAPHDSRARFAPTAAGAMGHKGAAGTGGSGGNITRVPSLDGDLAIVPVGEDNPERPTKRRRAGGAGSIAKQQASQQPAGKFGNLQEMFASQQAIKQRTLAEARSMRDSGAAHGGSGPVGGAGGPGSGASMLTGSVSRAAGGVDGGGGRPAAGFDAAGPSTTVPSIPDIAASSAASAAAVVRLVASLAPPRPGTVEMVAAGTASAKLALLERFAVELLPPGCPELLLLVLRSSAEWVQLVLAMPLDAAETQHCQQAGDLAAATGAAVAAAQAAACRACCVVLLATLRDRVVLPPFGTALIGEVLTAALDSALHAVLQAIPELIRDPIAAALVGATAQIGPVSLGDGSAAEALATAAGDVLMQMALCLTGASVELALLPAARRYLARGEQPMVGVLAQCTCLEKQLIRCSGGGVGLGAGGGGSAAHGSGQTPGDSRRVSSSLLGAVGRGLVVRLLPVAMLLQVVEIEEPAEGEERHVTFDRDRLAGPDGTISSILDEFRSGAGKGATRPQEHDAGVATAMAGGLKTLAALLSCRRSSQLAAATLQALVLGVRQARASLLQTASDYAAIAAGTAAATTAASTTAAAVATACATSIASSAAAASAALPDLPEELWLVPLEPAMAAAAAAAADAAWYGAGIGAGAPGYGVTQAQDAIDIAAVWPPVRMVLEFIEPWLAPGAGAVARGHTSRAADQLPPAVQLAALAALRDLVAGCPDGSVGGSGAALERVLFAALCSPNGVVRSGGAALLRSCLRPTLLLEMFKPSNEPAPAGSAAVVCAARELTSRLYHNVVEVQPPLPAAVRCSLLAAAVGLAGPDALCVALDSAPQLVLMVLGCLGVEDAQLRAAACSALESLTSAVDVTAERLLLKGPHAPMVLNNLGSSILKAPRLLPELCRLLNVTDAQLVRTIVPHAIGPLCCSNSLDELRELARRLDLPPAELFTLHAHHAYAYAFWKEASSFDAFMERVEKEVLEKGHGDVVGRLSMARMMTKQTIILAGEPSVAWQASGSLEPPPGLHERIQVFMTAIAAESKEMETDDFVQELLLGEVAAGLFELFGKQLEPQSAANTTAPAAAAATSAVSVAGGAGGVLGSPHRGRHHGHHHLHLQQPVSSGGSSYWLTAADSVDAEALQALRSLSVLVLMLGNHLGGHVPPVMVLLTAAVTRAICSSPDLQLQSLAGWRVFLRCLTSTAPYLLERVAVQASVVLLPLLQSPRPAVSSSAAGVLTMLVVDNKEHVRRALGRMPPLPADVPGLERVNAVLQAELQLAEARKRLAQLADSLQHDSLEVRHVALGELRFFLTDQRAFVADLMARAMSGRSAAGGPGSGGTDGGRAGVGGAPSQKQGKRGGGGAGGQAGAPAPGGGGGGCGGGASDAELLSRLLSALLRCCENTVRTPLGKDIRVRCGECLGLLGALDPARVVTERRAPPDLLDQEHDGTVAGVMAVTAGARGGNCGPYALEVALVEQLVRVMETTGDLQVYRFTSYALQCLLQHYSSTSGDGGGGRAVAAGVAGGVRSAVASPEPEGLYGEIRTDIRPLVQPYLTTRYTLEDVGRVGRSDADSWLTGVALFNTPKRPSYRAWMRVWIRAMLRYAVGPHQAAFNAMMPVMRQDLPLMTFLLPQVVHAVLVSGNAAATEAVRREVVAVLQAGAAGPSEADGQLELYLQALFGLLDVLGRWVKDAWQAASIAGGTQLALAAADDVTELPPRAQYVRAFIESIPMETLARAASRCGAHARAVQTFEAHMRSEATKAHCTPQPPSSKAAAPSATSGGLNPAAEVSRPKYKALNADVSFLLEAYSQLGEPDGLAGLCAMRPGGLSEADQVLVAERAGQWSDAMALHEAAMRREAAAADDAAEAGLGTVGAALATLRRSTNGGGGAVPQAKMQSGIAGGSGGPRGSTAGAGGITLDVSGGGGSRLGLGSSQAGYVRCLLAMGHSQAVLSSVDGLLARGSGGPAGQKQLAALGVAAAWRLGRWPLLRCYLRAAEAADPNPAATDVAIAGGAALSPGDQWELDIGYLLEALQGGDWERVRVLLEGYREESMAVLPALAQESYVRAYPHMVRLHMMQEMSDVLSLLDPSCGWAGLSATERARRLRWQERMAATQSSLPTQEPLLGFRRQLSALMGDRDAEAAAWLATAKLCRANGHLDAATSAVLEAGARGVGGAAALESAKLLLARDLHHRAASELQTAIVDLTSASASSATSASAVAADSRRLLARLKLCLARWSAGQGGCAPAELRRLFEEALDADRAWDKPHFHYARYLDQTYQDARRRQTSSGTRQPISGQGKSAGDRFGGRSKVMTGEERQYYEYLPDVIRHYGEAITKGHKHVMQALPRMLTLYCEHGSDQQTRGSAPPRTGRENRAATEVLNTMKQLATQGIAPPKWLVALPQLISRIAHSHKEVSEVIRLALVRLGEAFPQQVLWSAAAVCRSVVPKRRDAAAEVFKLVSHQARRSGNHGLLTLLDQFSALSDQMIKLCHWQPPTVRNKIVSTASAHREFEHLVRMLPCEVMVPTQQQFRAPLPPAATGNRALIDHPSGPTALHSGGGGLVKIAGIKDELVIMQSLMKPKKMTFVGSDGADYSFLAKPKDDLRKDYRLMDFAGLLNALFGGDAASRRRGLRLRTYAVVALTEDCGILQWVDGLVPYKAAIEDVYMAERLINKREWVAWIRKLWESWTEPTNKAKLLSLVLAKLPPRMHRWLLTKYPEPAAWLSARANFTRTNAVWCMVGHMLGLGDRHGENILLDTTCGDTVQVDFGCLFDKGLTLEVPEMVPFRLTQNIVDGFGITGVEGMYRRCTETTLQVLRQHRDTLMTCAETFLHDPLVEWASRTQRGGGGTTLDGAGGEVENPAAKDALATIEGRLSGTLLGVQSIPTLPLSCEGQAARLISEATDKENLGRMYVWWMPWA